MPRAVDMRVMPVRRLVLDMRRVDRDPARLLLRRLVDLRVIRERRPARLRQNLRDRSRQRRLAMINMANRPYVAVRLRPLKLRFAHRSPSSCCSGRPELVPGRPNSTRSEENTSELQSLIGNSSADLVLKK